MYYVDKIDDNNEIIYLSRASKKGGELLNATNCRVSSFCQGYAIYWKIKKCFPFKSDEQSWYLTKFWYQVKDW